MSQCKHFDQYSFHKIREQGSFAHPHTNGNESTQVKEEVLSCRKVPTSPSKHC
ncbi:MAG: hypothetical protein GF311_27385 [Candidatus Lokiarchaeota archaeon]|nr:hypothetical protein [Candidatus Lokiarchaeota archaeon]